YTSGHPEPGDVGTASGRTHASTLIAFLGAILDELAKPISSSFPSKWRDVFVLATRPGADVTGWPAPMASFPLPLASAQPSAQPPSPRFQSAAGESASTAAL